MTKISISEVKEKLSFLGVVSLGSRDGLFSPAEHIFMPGDDEPEVDIVCIGGHFKEHFLKKEISCKPITGSDIYAYDSESLLVDGIELSCEDLWAPLNAISIRELYELLLVQKNGNDGDLDVTGIRNLIPVHDPLSDEIYVVTVYYKHGWHIISRKIEDTNNSKYNGYPVRIFLAKKI